MLVTCALAIVSDQKANRPRSAPELPAKCPTFHLNLTEAAFTKGEPLFSFCTLLNVSSLACSGLLRTAWRTASRPSALALEPPVGRSGLLNGAPFFVTQILIKNFAAFVVRMLALCASSPFISEGRLW